MSKVLVAEISGKRPGGKSARQTESLPIKYDKVIISNNSDGYDTDWPIVDVPEDYVEWYKANIKTSDNAWYAPMNRSYAIKYARENGYDYLVQLDDNIVLLELKYAIEKDGIVYKYDVRTKDLVNDFIDMYVCVMENTNAAMVGAALAGMEPPGKAFLAEHYCYSFFALNLKTCADIFQGDFEDDIEYRLKLRDLGYPVVKVCPFKYGKTGQISNKDESGNRAAYTAAGLKRGEHMRIIHGDVYSCGFSNKLNSTHSTRRNLTIFKHHVKPFKVGVLISDKEAITNKMQEILAKYAPKKEDSYKVKIKKRKM